MTITQPIAIAITRKFLQQKFHSLSRLYKQTITIMSNTDYMRVIRRIDTGESCNVEQYYSSQAQDYAIHAYYSSHLANVEIDTKTNFYPCIQVDNQYHVWIHSDVEIFNISEFGQIELVEKPFTIDVKPNTKCFMVRLKRETLDLSAKELPVEWQIAHEKARKAIEQRKHVTLDTHTINRIKSIPNYTQDNYLMSFLSRLEIGKTLTQRQLTTLAGKENKGKR